PGVVDERATRVEVLANEHPIGAEAAFGDERIRPGQRRGGVLVAWEPEAARRPQRGRARLACGGQDRRGLAFGALGVSFGSRCGLLRPALLGLEFRGGSAALLAEPASLSCRSDEHGSMQPLGLLA